MRDKQDYGLLNGLALAYIGDAVYELFVRESLIRQGNTRPNMLHQKATKYVSANAQADLMYEMLERDVLTEREKEIYRRGRNAKSHTTAKNADVKTYRISTGFEAVMGYLHLEGETERLQELMTWCVQARDGGHDFDLKSQDHASVNDKEEGT
ncbi:Mini-ribonuclease 3 [Vagococcus elongatus]|uniref:Mini-ribonuclease 3 n=1 Tax=Vagococcus elongatus TaxID=180344 RepID=A0A430B1A7_9ENTE|nr:Mini-ribonuclease 3 [Vagococcus elongatus]RSU14079.1 Mini-ribonuclease 3 [Vagococcus elongatus]